MPIRSKLDGTLKEITDCKVKVADDWKQCEKAYVKVNGEWKECWSNSTVVTVGEVTNFTLPIKDYSSTVSFDSVIVKNVKLRLYFKSTNELIGENNVGDVTLTRSNNEEIVVNGTSGYSCSFKMYILNPSISVYATLSSVTYIYAEFEYDEVVINY